jgi:hypothetical protein
MHRWDEPTPGATELSAPLPERAAAFVAKAKDLGALCSAVIDAAGVGAGLWFSYLFVLLYLAIAVGSVTHRDLFFENPVKPNSRLARAMSPIGTEGELRPSGRYGRNRRDFCRGSQAGSTRSVDPSAT